MSRIQILLFCLATLVVAASAERSVVVAWDLSKEVTGLDYGEFDGTTSEYFRNPFVSSVEIEQDTSGTTVIWAHDAYTCEQFGCRQTEGTVKAYWCHGVDCGTGGFNSGDHTVLHSQSACGVRQLKLDKTGSRRHLFMQVSHCGMITADQAIAVRRDLDVDPGTVTVLTALHSFEGGGFLTSMAFVPGEDYAFVFQYANNKHILSVCDFGASAPCSLQEIARFDAYKGPHALNRAYSGATCSFYHNATSTLYWAEQQSSNADFDLMTAVVSKTSVNMASFSQTNRASFSGVCSSCECHIKVDETEQKLYFGGSGSSSGSPIYRTNMDGSGLETWADPVPGKVLKDFALNIGGATAGGPSVGISEPADMTTAGGAKTGEPAGTIVSTTPPTLTTQPADDMQPSTTPVQDFTHTVRMTVQLLMDLTTFNQKKEDFIVALATHSNVLRSQITVTPTEKDVRRRLLSKAVDVDVRIQTANQETANSLVTTLADTAALNTELTKLGLPEATVLTEPSVLTGQSVQATEEIPSSGMAMVPSFVTVVALVTVLAARQA